MFSSFPVAFKPLAIHEISLCRLIYSMRDKKRQLIDVIGWRFEFFAVKLSPLDSSISAVVFVMFVLSCSDVETALFSLEFYIAFTIFTHFEKHFSKNVF